MFARNTEDFRRMGEDESTTLIGWTYNSPIEKTCIKVKFITLKEDMSFIVDKGFIGRPTFEILSSDGLRQTWLEEHYKKYLRFDNNGHWICLCMERPPIGYKYKISWMLPGPRVSSIHPRQNFEARGFIEWLEKQVSNYLESVLDCILNTLCKDFDCDKNKIETSLMLPTFKGDQPQALEIIASMNVANLSSEPFPIGVGLAGKAFKRRRIETYCEGEKIPSLKKPSPYLKIADPSHKVLYSVPYVHRDNEKIVLAIFSVGTYDNEVAGKLIPNEEQAKYIGDITKKVGDTMWESYKEGVKK